MTSYRVSITEQTTAKCNLFVKYYAKESITFIMQYDVTRCVICISNNNVEHLDKEQSSKISPKKLYYDSKCSMHCNQENTG